MKKTCKDDTKNKTPFQQRLIELRGKKRQKDVAKELGVSRDCIVQWENDDTRQPALDKLILLADYYHVSLDYLHGRSCCRSVDNEYIRQQLGLSDQAINQLKAYNAHDSMFNLTNKAIGKEYAFLSWYDLRLPFINCLLTSGKLRQLINTMFLYVLPDKFHRLTLRFNDLQMSEIPKDSLYLASDTGLNDSIPFEMDTAAKKALFKTKLEILLDEIAEEYKKLIQHN